MNTSTTEVFRQKHSSVHHFLPQSRRDWLLVIVMILGFATAAHFSIAAVRYFLKVQSPAPEWILFLFSMTYTTVIMMSQIYSSALAHKLVPLTSKKAALLHILIQSTAAVIAFGGSVRFEQYVRGECSIPADLFVWILTITFILSLIGNIIFYSLYFQRQVRAAKQAVLESELSVLRAQINPHFLFNTLNSIAALIRSNPDEAERVTEYLADLFRYSLRSSKTPLVRLDDEIQSTELYLAIERARFGDRLDAQIVADSTVRNALVPSLMLQPLVENAVKHGANHCEGEFRIRIAMQTQSQRVVIRVEDSGPGFNLINSDALFERGTGLVNVRDRLFLVFPNESELRFEKHAVILDFPFRQTSEIAAASLFEHKSLSIG